MSQRLAAVVVGCFVLIPAGLHAVMQREAAAVPAITSLSTATLERGGRLIIKGSGFGPQGVGGRVEIGGETAWVTRWSDTSITAYPAEKASPGAAFVQVFAQGRASNPVHLRVLPQAKGKVNWRFQADSDYIYHRPAVRPDGTIVAHDSNGFVYAISPNGRLKWIFKTPAFAYGPPGVGSDNSVYVASISTIYALNPNGTRKWTFTDPNSQGVIAGPTVGPDGNIYAAMDAGGLGAIALSPSGQLLWNNAGEPSLREYGALGAEIVFGRSVSGGPMDQFYVAFDRENDPRLWAFGLNGTQKWTIQTGGQYDPFMQQQSQPAAGPSGTVYSTTLHPVAGWTLSAYAPQNGAKLWSFAPDPANGMSAPDVAPNENIYFSRSLSFLQAVGPAGNPRWDFFDGSIVDYPIAIGNNTVFAGGRPNFGEPGFVRAYRSGIVLWQVDLGKENGGNQIMFSRPRAGVDGAAIFFGTTILGGSSSDPYCYLYSVSL